MDLTIFANQTCFLLAEKKSTINNAAAPHDSKAQSRPVAIKNADFAENAEDAVSEEPARISS